jgi:hypothetical protein
LERGFPKIILTSDCQSLVKRLSGVQRDRSSLGAVVADIKSLKTRFQACIFSFSSRVTNVVAHKLARAAEPLFVIFQLLLSRNLFGRNYVMMLLNQ